MRPDTAGANGGYSCCWQSHTNSRLRFFAPWLFFGVVRRLLIWTHHRSFCREKLHTSGLWISSGRRRGEGFFCQTKEILITVFVLLAIGIAGLVTGIWSALCWFLIFVSAYLVAIRIIWYFQQMDNYKKHSYGGIVLSVAPDEITIRTSEQVSAIKWSHIKEIRAFPEMVLLGYGGNNMSAIPMSALGADLKNYIEEKVREHREKSPDTGKESHLTIDVFFGLWAKSRQSQPLTLSLSIRFLRSLLKQLLRLDRLYV